MKKTVTRMTVETWLIKFFPVGVFRDLSLLKRFKSNYLKNGESINNFAFSSELILIYRKKFRSVLCPVIFINLYERSGDDL